MCNNMPPNSKVLANLLETDDTNCKTGALRILRKVTIHPAIR